MSDLPGYVASGAALPWLRKQGLSTADIKKLPSSIHSGCDMECPICLSDVQDGDSVRTLPGCGHTFHRACIDLWVLRCADCPLCKCDVLRGGGAPQTSSVIV